MPPSCPSARPRRRGMTLIELLTSISIIALLSTILVGAVAAVWRQAFVSKSTTEFQAIAAAMEEYRSTYGRYPIFPEMNPSSATASGDVAFKLNAGNGLLLKVLSGSPDTGHTNYNPGLTRFLTLDSDQMTADLQNPLIQDAFTDTDIGVVVNTSSQGTISQTSLTSQSVVNNQEGTSAAPTVTRPLPQRVAIFSLGPRHQFITNWDYDAYTK